MVGRRSFGLILLGAAAALAAAPAPRRIVSTAPSITEMLYALGLGDRVVGVTNYCRYPPEARLKPKIGDYTSPNLESIAALRPDLVIVQTNPVRLSERLSALHLKSLEINQDSLAALYQSIRQVGDATGSAAQAGKLIDSIRTGLDQVRSRAAPLPRVPVMFVIGRNSGRLDGLYVAGRASYLNDIIEIAGGRNVFADAPAAYPSVTLEEVLARNPQVIADIGDMADDESATAARKRATLALWQTLPSLAAVKQHRVFAIAPDVFTIPGPRVVLAARQFFELLHPGWKAP